MKSEVPDLFAPVPPVRIGDDEGLDLRYSCICNSGIAPPAQLQYSLHGKILQPQPAPSVFALRALCTSQKVQGPTML